MHRLAISITDLGDSAVTVPLAAVTMVILFVWRRPRLAFGWGISIAGCAGATLVLKLLLASGAHHHYALSGLTSPSGHAAMSTAVYGGFALLLGGSLAPLKRGVATLGAVSLVVAIAASRIVLREHSIAEVVLGLSVGVAALAVFRGVLARMAPGRLPVIWLCAAALMAIGLMHGTRWHTERAIHGLHALIG